VLPTDCWNARKSAMSAAPSAARTKYSISVYRVASSPSWQSALGWRVRGVARVFVSVSVFVRCCECACECKVVRSR
jgi:hypothetical protein